jgi:hypothetical protein
VGLVVRRAATLASLPVRQRAASVGGMLTRGLRVVLVVLLFAVSGGAVAADAAPSSSAAAARKGRFQCHGLDREDVRGADPAYTRKSLADFSNHKRMCGAIWLPPPRRYFVPQGLAVVGRTAWVSGFQYHKGYGQRPCQLRRVDLLTGRQLVFHSAIFGRVGLRPRTYCRHGGGILKRGGYLWIVEKNKLWKVDPASTSHVLNATRVWRIKSPARGSAIVATRKLIGLVPYQERGRAYIHWFSFKQLRKQGVLDLGGRAKGDSQIGAVARTRVPTYVQGATLDGRGGLYLARSRLACGELITPGGRRLGFLPGAEGIQFGPRVNRLYAVSESGARPYVRLRQPLTAGVTRFEWPGLGHGRPSDCRFPRP